MGVGNIVGLFVEVVMLCDGYNIRLVSMMLPNEKKWEISATEKKRKRN